MRRLLCLVSGFVETWLTPGMWRLHLLGGIPVRVSGHILEEPTYEIRGDREYELRRCSRCGFVDEGWRYMG